ncbi:hypothetical protein AVEN_219052-1 [Araneus ventricosus]|uniref:Uncharacterized protein n=1 Tax=Araneus ventricosus TaxID=182803 RepID=A0A4Y2W6C6_ARAVE|nr:hypothetical protein AVEN_208414-1 [Araneus ventricosus]GBO32614.1 hypothetical protein AVEN_219052-1 [Araneus ventricosus]
MMESGSAPQCVEDYKLKDFECTGGEDEEKDKEMHGVRKDQTALAHLSSGHLKTLRFSRGDKKFNICTKCNMIEATPQHLLDCVALVYDDLLKRPDFVLEVMKANDLMDLI